MDPSYFDIQHSVERELKIMINGDSSTYIFVKISKNTSFKELAKIIQERLEWYNVKHLRIFQQQGVEIFNDDIDFLKSGATLYVSKGEDFDQNSCFSEYEIVKTLGEGGFGKVVLGIHKLTKEKFAIKIVNTGMIGNAMDIDLVFREAETLKSLTHKNIVKIFNCFTLKNMEVVFVMEYLEGGELLKYLLERKKLSEEESLHFFTQIMEAITYVHKESLIHRDLKLENLLLSDKENKIIKVVDFGIAGILSNLNVDNIHAGTLKYLAPEVFERRNNDVVSPALDVWSMGCILYALLVGNLPFRGSTGKSIIDKIKNSPVLFPEDQEAELSDEVKDLIFKCLDKNPKTRITMNEMSYHPWILGEKFASLNNRNSFCEDNEEFKTYDNHKDRIKVGFSQGKTKEITGRFRSESYNVKGGSPVSPFKKQGSPISKMTASHHGAAGKKGSLFNIKIESLNKKDYKSTTPGLISSFKK